jgi:hypothetical protein
MEENIGVFQMCFVIQNFVGPSANLKGSKGYNFAKFLF